MGVVGVTVGDGRSLLVMAKLHFIALQLFIQPPGLLLRARMAPGFIWLLP